MSPRSPESYGVLTRGTSEHVEDPVVTDFVRVTEIGKKKLIGRGKGCSGGRMVVWQWGFERERTSERDEGDGGHRSSVP